MTISTKIVETVSLTINNIELNLTFDEVVELQQQLKEIINNNCGKNEPFKGKEINGNNDLLDRIKKESEDRFKYEKKVPFDWNNISKYDYTTYSLSDLVSKINKDNIHPEIKISCLDDKQYTHFGLVDDKSWESLKIFLNSPIGKEIW